MNYTPFTQERTFEKLQLLHVVPEPEAEILGLSKSSYFFKRLFDVMISLLVIAFVLSWLLPLLAILIKIDSRGPVFFIQQRVGAFGRVFHCIKLRTMFVNQLANVQQAQVNDPRITRMGRFLRISCFDELPQFLNVLMGDMSIVGPRPHMLKDCREFSKVISNYSQRNLLKPGITGMAQVKGYRGHTIDFFDVSHRYKWDMFYVRNCSFRLDMRIMRLTITSTLKMIYSSFIVQQKDESVSYQLESPEYLN